MILTLLHGSALACISKFGELYKMLLNSFLGGFIRLHIHQRAQFMSSLCWCLVFLVSRSVNISVCTQWYFFFFYGSSAHFLGRNGTKNQFCDLAIWIIRLTLLICLLFIVYRFRD